MPTNNENIPRQKYLVVDDEIVKNDNDKEDFILDIGVSEDLALFASDYDQALAMIQQHSAEIAIYFIDSRIPKNERDLFVPQVNNDGVEWGISLIPEINKLSRTSSIVIYSAYVSKSYLNKQAEQYNNIIGYFGKPEGVKHRKKLYQNAIAGKRTLETQKIPASNQFDYSKLDTNLSVYLREKTENIRKLIRKSAQDIIDIGESLIEIKNKLEYGQFYAWLETEFSWSYRTASRFMRVAETFSSDNMSDVDILPTALYQLSSPNFPKAAIEEAINRAKSGEFISAEKVKEIKNRHQTAKISSFIDEIPKRRRQEKREILVNAEQNIVVDLPQQSSKTKQEIVRVIRQQNLWQLGKHLLFCGQPNSPEFIKQLPTKISLNLAFPTDSNWLFSFSQIDSNMSFNSKYLFDLDTQLLLEAIERFIKTTTDEDDDITICFIPHPEVLPLVDRLGCRCFIAEPEQGKCEAVRSTWEKLV
jgi:hypothetical protein